MPHPFDPYRDRYAPRAAGMTGSEIRALFGLIDRPEIISLAGGNTDTSIVAHRIPDCVGSVLARDPAAALGYGTGAGRMELHEQLVSLMSREKIVSEAHNLVVTNGAQQGLELLA